MIWAPPAVDNDVVPSWIVTVRPDEQGLFYEVSDDNCGPSPRHLGAIDTGETNAAAWPAPVDERQLASEGRDVTSLWSRFAAAGEGAGTNVVSVHRFGADLVARLRTISARSNSSAAEAALLHLVWRLIAFSEINGHVPAPTVPFALERYIANGPPPQDMLVRIRHADGAVTVAVHDTRGAQVLLMDGLIAREPADMAEIDLQDDMPREMRL
jgi:hypothetical protein